MRKQIERDGNMVIYENDSPLFADRPFSARLHKGYGSSIGAYGKTPEAAKANLIAMLGDVTWDDGTKSCVVDGIIVDDPETYAQSGTYPSWGEIGVVVLFVAMFITLWSVK